MKPVKLSKEEALLITDPADTVILEIIKGMDINELRSFDVYRAKDINHYNGLQISWLITEKHLISKRLNKEVSEVELIDDITKWHNGERFKVFYVLKYPHLVIRIY